MIADEKILWVQAYLAAGNDYAKATKYADEAVLRLRDFDARQEEAAEERGRMKAELRHDRLQWEARQAKREASEQQT
jgi:hypothetical protein